MNKYLLVIMKKLFCIFLVALFFAPVEYVKGETSLNLQDEYDESAEEVSSDNSLPENLRKKYFHLSFSSTKISYGDSNLSYRSKYGFSLTSGKSFFLHKKPIANMLFIGLDVTWFDLTYTYYKYDLRSMLGGLDPEDDEDLSIKDYQAEIALQVGPSFHVYPIKSLHIEAYFRYAPTFSMLVEDGSFGCNYATYFVSGGAVSYSFIGLGAEARFGNCKYKGIGGDDTDAVSASRTKFRGYRVYLSFRF